jgi:hypothetical protein
LQGLLQCWFTVKSKRESFQAPSDPGAGSLFCDLEALRDFDVLELIDHAEAEGFTPRHRMALKLGANEGSQIIELDHLPQALGRFAIP